MDLLKVCSLQGKFRLNFLKFLSLPSLKIFSKRQNPSLFTGEPDLYRPGGFHRVFLGDRLDSARYTVLRKLGYGQYSTVWLARDSRNQKYVAVKILRADCTNNIFERDILSKISNASTHSTHEGRHFVLPALDEFKHHGPNGEHVCFVFDVMGYHLGYQPIHYEHGRLPIKSVKSIVRQILLGLDFLHRECGIIHTDLKHSNIVMELDNADQSISQYLSSVSPRIDHQGTPLREAITTPPLSTISNPHIRIIDFGVASWKDKHLSDRIQSPALRAPEVTIGAPWDSKVDIWSLGCLTVEFTHGIIPFNGQGSKRGTWTADDDRLARMIEILGPFPTEFLAQGTHTTEFFNDKGELRRISKLETTGLKRLLNGQVMPFMRPDDMSEQEVYVFIDFVKGMLAIDPSWRNSAAGLLQHKWLAM